MVKSKQQERVYPGASRHSPPSRRETLPGVNGEGGTRELPQSGRGLEVSGVARADGSSVQRVWRTRMDAVTESEGIAKVRGHEGYWEAVLGQILEEGIAVSGSDFGNIQLLDAGTSSLRIVAQRGFPKWWVDFWNGFAAGQGACGTALERGERVIVEDVERSPIFMGRPALKMQLKAEVRAVQSTPLMSRSGTPLGVFSTHWRRPHRPEERALRLLDVLAKRATDIIDRAGSQAAMQERILNVWMGR